MKVTQDYTKKLFQNIAGAKYALGMMHLIGKNNNIEQDNKLLKLRQNNHITK